MSAQKHSDVSDTDLGAIHDIVKYYAGYLDFALALLLLLLRSAVPRKCEPEIVQVIFGRKVRDTFLISQLRAPQCFIAQFNLVIGAFHGHTDLLQKIQTRLGRGDVHRAHRDAVVHERLEREVAYGLAAFWCGFANKWG